jgi:hypothetical protein
MARFHRYSFHNQLLIGCQRPDATYVRGFKSWIDIGRVVRKGEKGIAIFAPRPWRRPAADVDDPEAVEQGVSFAVGHVFDVAQTDPIPNFANPDVGSTPPRTSCMPVSRNRPNQCGNSYGVGCNSGQPCCSGQCAGPSPGTGCRICDPLG